jgi:IS4 transposase
LFVFTTLGSAYTATQILEMYRMRWQIELVFKRLKSLLGLGHLKKHDEQAARAWLQGKLLVACMIEKLLAMAEHISPLGIRD